MPNIQQTVTVCQELQLALNVFTGLVADVKAGKTPSVVVADALPSVIAALSGLGALTTEVTAANGLAVDNTVVLWAAQLKQVLFPGSV